MTSERRTRLSPEARRAQLIALGVQMLATQTLDELSVEAIAAEAGISRGLLFHYFSSKQNFYREVVRATAADLIARTAPDPALGPLDALRASLDAFVGYVEENPAGYKSLVRGAAGGDGEMLAIFDETRSALAQRTVEMAEAGGFELPATARIAAHGWIAFAEECVIRWLDHPEVDRDALLDLLGTALPLLLVGAAAGAGAVSALLPAVG